MLIKNISTLLISLTLICLTNTQANGQALFMSELAQGQDVPKTFGVSVDAFTLEQGYDFVSLEFDLPGLTLANLPPVDIVSDTDYKALKLDAWVLPFLNAFVMAGKIDGGTAVVFESLDIAGLSLPLNNLIIDIDGDVYGGGLTLAYGTNKWFASLTTTVTDTNLTGAFASSIKAVTLQPRAGLRFEKIDVWVNALYLDADESHEGLVDLGLSAINIPAIPFSTTLSQKQDINYGLGLRYQINKSFEATVDFGFGQRKNQLFSLSYRF